MKIVLVSVGDDRPAKNREMLSLVQLYLERADKYTACSFQIVASEAGFWAWMGKQSGRTMPLTILLDGAGKMWSSEELARRLHGLREQDIQLVVLAVGPADGWSDQSLKRASETLSLGPMTLPHELARVVVAEQIYRALTILAGHPYHSGH